jgi:para-nitrobenzyl esterase
MSKINRRTFAGTIGAGALAAPFATAATTSAPSSSAIADTNSGKIRGVLHDRVYAFRGLPYGASTEGENRFMPPVKPTPWPGVRDTLNLGQKSAFYGAGEIPEVAAMDIHEASGEDCLCLNVWTPALKSGKRPVMLWLHGGGFAVGSAGYIIYDGANLARKQDVVVVGVNHRLNVLGYLYLAEAGGEKFSRSSNVGMLDIVAALEWVRDNIANFGGDPGNVTIFGQSGGGAKVSTLLAMPMAKGLFHRAIFQSGAGRGAPKDGAVRAAQTLMSKANVKTVEELQRLPLDKLFAAAQTVPGAGGGPVVDGSTLPSSPFDPAAPEASATVPVLCGTVETEVTFFPGTQLEPIDDATLHNNVKMALRGASDSKVDEVIDLYRNGRPGRSNTDLWLIFSSDNGMRQPVVTQAERKAQQGKAPVYMYYFNWNSPVRQGKLRCFHTLEIPFAFYNHDEAKPMTGFGDDRYALADKLSTAWATFARTGNPNNKLLPAWTPFTNAERATMILGNDCKLVNDPNKEERLALAGLRAKA